MIQILEKSLMSVAYQTNRQTNVQNHAKTQSYEKIIQAQYTMFCATNDRLVMVNCMVNTVLQA